MLDSESQFYQSGKWKIPYVFVFTNQWALFVGHQTKENMR